MKFDIVYDNGVSLQIIVVYMKFPKEVLVVGWDKRAILPQFCNISNFAGMHFYEILHVGYTQKQVGGQMKCETYGISKSFF